MTNTFSNISDFTPTEIAYSTADGDIIRIPVQSTFDLWLAEAAKIVDHEPETVDAIINRISKMNEFYMCGTINGDIKKRMTKMVACELSIAADSKMAIVPLWCNVEKTFFYAELNPENPVIYEESHTPYAADCKKHADGE